MFYLGNVEISWSRMFFFLINRLRKKVIHFNVAADPQGSSLLRSSAQKRQIKFSILTPKRFVT